MEKIYNIWFSNLDIKNITKLKLLDKYSAKEIWNLSYNHLLQEGIDERNILQILNSKNLEEAKKIFDYMLKKNIKIISVNDYAYPMKLHHIDDKPAFLYVRGNLNILDNDAVRNCWMQDGN